MTTVRILCDNNIGRLDFLGEHGFAALIEGKQGRFLFDTGQGLTLPHNLKAAGLELRDLQAVVLSHGHYDHTGGLPCVLQQGSKDRGGSGNQVPERKLPGPAAGRPKAFCVKERPECRRAW